MATKFYALSQLGWGVGETLVEARDNYLDAQHRNFPKLSDEELNEAWGYIWQAPEGAVGFFHGVQGLYWTFDNHKDSEEADPKQRIAYLGNVPDFAQTIA